MMLSTRLFFYPGVNHQHLANYPPLDKKLLNFSSQNEEKNYWRVDKVGIHYDNGFFAVSFKTSYFYAKIIQDLVVGPYGVSSPADFMLMFVDISIKNLYTISFLANFLLGFDSTEPWTKTAEMSLKLLSHISNFLVIYYIN
jgi:hypothetical protein